MPNLCRKRMDLILRIGRHPTICRNSNFIVFFLHCRRNIRYLPFATSFAYFLSFDNATIPQEFESIQRFSVSFLTIPKFYTLDKKTASYLSILDKNAVFDLVFIFYLNYQFKTTTILFMLFYTFLNIFYRR